MSDLLREYRGHRDTGLGHMAACNRIGRRYGIDPDSVSRTITRAEAAEARARPGASSPAHDRKDH